MDFAVAARAISVSPEVRSVFLSFAALALGTPDDPDTPTSVASIKFEAGVLNSDSNLDLCVHTRYVVQEDFDYVAQIHGLGRETISISDLHVTEWNNPLAFALELLAGWPSVWWEDVHCNQIEMSQVLSFGWTAP